MKRFLLLLPLLLLAAPANAEKWIECAQRVVDKPLLANRGKARITQFQASISPGEETAQVISDENQYISKIKFFPGSIVIGPIRVGDCTAYKKKTSDCMSAYFDAYFKINRKSLSYDYKADSKGFSSQPWFGSSDENVESWSEGIGSCKIIPSPVKENQI